MAVVHPKLEPWEFEALQEKHGWEAPLEYLDGQAVVTPPGDGLHGASLVECLAAIREWQDATGDGGQLLADSFVLVGDQQLAPDVSYWTAARRPEIRRGRVDSVPDLVVEIASPSSAANDLGAKRRAYTAAGVREQWLVDSAERRILRVGADGGETLLLADGVLRSAGLTGFSAPVSALIGR